MFIPFIRVRYVYLVLGFLFHFVSLFSRVFLNPIGISSWVSMVTESK